MDVEGVSVADTACVPDEEDEEIAGEEDGEREMEPDGGTKLGF